LDVLSAQYAAALQEYLVGPREAGLMQAYDLGRYTLTVEEGVTELRLAHEKVLVAALSSTGASDEQERLSQRAAEFLIEAMAPLRMILRGYREANSLLQRLNQNLEERVKEQTEELEQASRRKDEFLAMLAHELRNLLAPISNALQMLRLARADAAEVGPARDLMERQVRNLVRLIDDLMDVSRIARGKFHLRMERLELATVVQSAIEISRPHIEAAGHELMVMLPPGRLEVQADSPRLAQALANLLNNATKYTEPGGCIWLTAERNGAQAVVRVRDTGVGIPAEMLGKIFNMFVQVPSSLERSQGGMGIGLPLVKGLVEMHGGSVEAHSDGPGQGSEFIVRLPAAPNAEASPGPELPAPREQHSGKSATLRLLVVDDNRESANSLALLLKLTGHDARVAYDGHAALELVRTFQPQVVFQDLQMPGMSGFEVARCVREQLAARDVVLIALTAYGSDEDRRGCLAAGFDHHLVKPVDWSVLQQLLTAQVSLD
jgi:signal transduction histidine kinase/ActR/RegA family two-component response regulator